jgi:putative transposase
MRFGSDFVGFKNGTPVLSLEKDAPEPRPVEHLDDGRIVETPMVGGLHHRYGRRAA